MKLIEAGGAGTQTPNLLDRIATALDCPTEAFSNPTLHSPDDTVELLRLWGMIKDDQDRRKVLSFIRTVAL
ncbi:MAG: hypothetical protein EON55_06380 [Alphaproteobacteria bacterium]|nr:MAG: hypothetical protein EON55_06380 [Alphaproteobacteria bacterium]